MHLSWSTDLLYTAKSLPLVGTSPDAYHKYYSGKGNVENAAVDSCSKAGSITQLIKKGWRGGKSWQKSAFNLLSNVNLCLSEWFDCLLAIASSVTFSCNMRLGSCSNCSTKCPAFHPKGKEANALM